MKKIIFVYNLDSSLFSNAVDSVHKLVSPDTYRCNICKIAYGVILMKKEWKEFIKALPYPVEFIHRDESTKKNPEYTEFPLVVLQNGDQSKIIATPEEINKARTVEDLKQVVKTAITKI